MIESILTGTLNAANQFSMRTREVVREELLELMHRVRWVPELGETREDRIEHRRHTHKVGVVAVNAPAHVSRTIRCVDDEPSAGDDEQPHVLEVAAIREPVLLLHQLFQVVDRHPGEQRSFLAERAPRDIVVVEADDVFLPLQVEPGLATSVVGREDVRLSLL